jgi:hypothetical protein
MFSGAVGAGIFNRFTGAKSSSGDIATGSSSKDLQRTESKTRIEKYLDAVASTADTWSPQCASCLRSFKPIVICAIRLILLVAPVYKWLYLKAYQIVSVLPTNVMQMVFGAALCFFGGTFVASISAIEAFRTMGGEQTLKDLKYIFSQMSIVSEASAEDDKVDADHDGIADVDQMTASQLAEHKMKLAMLSVDEPDKLQAAVGSFWAACLAVLATLRLQFAQTTALALGIADICLFPVLRLLAPLLAWALGKNLKHWVEPIITGSLKLIAIVCAWFLQAIVSAFYSGLRGGKMFAEGAFGLLAEHGILKKFPDSLVPDKEPFNPDTTYVDEIIGYPLAAGGFYFQIVHGFELPFPLNVIFLPLTIIEWGLEILIVWSDTTTMPAKL